MSTSYTGTLKFGKPAAGDTGWGNTLNGEVTDMVEEAIAGMSTINTWSAATPAVHTLTEANGSTSESRAAILRLTDTTGDIASVANLIVPDNTKLYCIINETGHTVTVKTASGTGIDIPTAVQNNVVCNGTNVVEQVNYQASSRAGTLTSDGLTVAGTFKVGASGATVTTIADEDDMVSDSAFKLATQQSIKAYVDNNGSFPYVEEIVPWGLSTTMTTSALVTITDSNNYSTVAEFTVPGNADTQYHKIEISPVFFAKVTSDSLSLGTVDTVYRLQKKSKTNTGVSLGTVVDRGQFGGSGSYFFYFTVSGDKRQVLGNAVKVADNNYAGNPAGKREIKSFHYNATEDKTYIAFNNGSSTLSASTFASGTTAYIGYDGWSAVGDWVDVGSALLQTTTENAGSSIYVPASYTLPTIPAFLVQNSNSAATEFRFQIKPGDSNREIRYEKTYVSAQNIRRG